jgi:hypothetical protein
MSEGPINKNSSLRLDPNLFLNFKFSKSKQIKKGLVFTNNKVVNEVCFALTTYRI